LALVLLVWLNRCYLISLANPFFIGEIYSAYDIFSGEEVAIKIETGSSPFSQLRNEHKSYKALGNHIGLPHIKWFGKDFDHNIMVLTLLGPSLERLWVTLGCQFNLETVVDIAEQMVRHCVSSMMGFYLTRYLDNSS
jgi:hypothetical protein